MDNDIQFMRRALQLAKQSQGHVSPNPMVGCVIVHEGEIIGEGYHQQVGGPHAEVNAVNNVKDHTLLPESTMYVTLEPCSHFGKTPPCADLIVDKNFKKVVIAAGDPNPEVNGRGIERIRAAGIEVQTGVLDKESSWLNKRFNTFHQKKRPYIVLKWAQTSDGFMARENGDSKWISNGYSRQLVHKWRSEETSILVGKNTVERDDPELNVRSWSGDNPVKIVIDSGLKIDQTKFKLFNEDLVLVFNQVKNDRLGVVEMIKLDKDRFLLSMMDELYARKIQSVFVEGGSYTLSKLIEIGLWDEARVFKGTIDFQQGIPAPEIKMKPASFIRIQDDELRVYSNED